MWTFPAAPGMIPFGLAWLLFALALGSFANVCIHRIPRGESVVRPRSRCPRCAALIRWNHNIPLASFLWLRGRCAACRGRIAWRYPAVEALMAALFGALLWRHGPAAPALAIGGTLTFLLVVIAFIDIDFRIIPNALSTFLLTAGIALAAANPVLGEGAGRRLGEAAAGAGIGFLFMAGLAKMGRMIWRKESLGGGDIKLMAGLGAFLGWRGALTTLFLGSFLGTSWAAPLMLFRRLRRGSYLPFGPFLAAGAWLTWMYLSTRLLK